MNAKNEKLQEDKFRNATRQFETDNYEKRFDERLSRIAKALPPKDNKPDGASPPNERAFL
ncbi:hypothetical protein [Rhizobium sp. IY2]|uniref:hypothetical protein n=1 Tax=Rhizobium sp. IY2 TaxID=3397853 RepID=UPI0039E0E0BB